MLSTAEFYRIKHAEAAARLVAMQGTVDELIRATWLAIREALLDWWDEPQVSQMIDDGCPNSNLYLEG